MEHQLTPDRYHPTIGSHEPVLSVSSGDTVSTTTVDAGGWDAGGDRVTSHGNAQTGPIYVGGAQPGDVLSVTLDRVWPNRGHGFCSRKILPNVLDPGHDGGVRESEWLRFVLDFASGSARIENPPVTLKDLVVPIRPMIGCFGVAPPQGQAISTATSGPHGGNMDYRGFGPGVTAYFPVFAEGALFHIGDGHGWQSDGEILGSGIEVSMDVTFTLVVIKNKTIRWPRGHNDDYIFTAGNCRPLDQAVQHSTSEMLRWLTDDYGLSLPDANILLGMFVQYEVGNVIDPAYTMICKMPRSVLPETAPAALVPS
ncbi:MAG: acetamidase/formamidase family protein [Chloroflexi bacterium]|nr:acetamidase/formamidase family protein [Chloroflexota bacterium]